MKRLWKLEIRLENTSNKALYLQIADAIIDDIKKGRLKKGDLLPSTRTLSTLLNVNRNTVVRALTILITEQWLVSVERKGIFVAHTISQDSPVKTLEPLLERQETDLLLNNNIVFDNGYPDSKIVPIAELARAYRQIFNRSAKWQMMGYGSELGDSKFITHIANMLNHQRGMNVVEKNICITRGGQMAIFMIAHSLLTKGDYILVENPGYNSAWEAFKHAGANLIPIHVDDQGIVTSEIIEQLKTNKRIKAIYLTPHHQFPTTVTLSLKRRLEIIELSNQYGFTVIEDDYDNEFHYNTRPILPLCSHINLENYIYIGTLSKVVAPSLRIGYLVTSKTSLIKKVSKLRKIIDIQGDRIMELAILELIKEGIIKKHIKKATIHYKEKRDYTYSLLKHYLDQSTHFTLPEGGLAFWIKLNRTIDFKNFCALLTSKGVDIVNPNEYYLDHSSNGLRISFGRLTKEDLEKGIKIIAECLTQIKH
ncbi:MocR-like pyridoxine biosynthesis transcription factor PdxR [Myroides odoratimimus]|uniref:MocR-like pyridoxine biosynthesis transcription factor PdxR n=2 Tax=Myroides odoratimimus TaxID=76832 RepID=UPI002DBDD933|nr:PLP-dependent aminotransferase family protein [Myroides odoratimimus]MEC4094006.1 PLP-dependent aminotransferase family protein [Myroides odoratimimus]